MKKSWAKEMRILGTIATNEDILSRMEHLIEIKEGDIATMKNYPSEVEKLKKEIKDITERKTDIEKSNERLEAELERLEA